ncbi:hypothetical protein VNO77_20731 [Canavalia gladiata]|uniref:Uncharacterized protein n=1 Tax=Canavalia gladiata TaxID=3824 RepID=A0AAN9QLH7_CANGL
MECTHPQREGPSRSNFSLRKRLLSNCNHHRHCNNPHSSSSFSYPNDVVAVKSLHHHSSSSDTVTFPPKTKLPNDVVAIAIAFHDHHFLLAFETFISDSDSSNSHTLTFPPETKTSKRRRCVVAMPITRCNSQIPAPLPSPIPTGRGSRSAASEIFSQFLEKTLQLPELTLPATHLQPAPAEIDLWALPLASDGLMLRSVKEFGAFRIRSHGISGNELGTMADEAERVFQDLKNDAVERNGAGGEMISCVRSNKGVLEFTPHKSIGDQTHRNFWVHMGNVAIRLDSIVEQVTQVLQQDTSEEFKERIQDTESVICLCRYPHDNVPKQNEGVSVKRKDRLCDHALRFYLPMERCIFYVQTERGPLSFDAGPENIVVTVGKQLEEWSHGVFKCVPGEMIFMPSFQSSPSSFSLELICSVSSSLNPCLNDSGKIISLTDQILIVFCLAFLYKFLYFIFS